VAESAGAAVSGGTRERRALFALTAVAVALRLLFVWAEPETHPIGDETMWVNAGVTRLPAAAFSPTQFRFIFHPPVYPYFIGAFFALFGSLTAVKVAQAFVAALLVPAVGRLGTMALGPRPGLFAAAIAAFYPELVWFSAHFWAETLFLTLFWWAFERVAVADRDGSSPRAAAAGLLWGLAVLTRETVLYFAPIAALFLLWRRPKGAVRAAVFLGVLALTVAPWTYRNWRAFGAFVPVSTAGALNLWQGNAMLSRQEVYEQIWAVHGPIERYELARTRGLEAIRDRQPWWIFEKVRDEMPNFWEVDSQALVHLRKGVYAEMRPVVAYAASFVVLAPYLLVLALAVAALATLPLRRLPMLLLAFLAYYNLIHVATHGYARYRLPALPALFILAGWAWARERRPSGAAAPAWRRGLVAAAAFAIGASLAPSLRLMLRPRALVSENARYAPGASPEGVTPAEEGTDR
jgi:Dolichyl-phosphate-mannose-protein mannosyltransferase